MRQIAADPTPELAGTGEPAVELAIGGMTCAACAARIEKKLNKLDGVTATVNYATERAQIHGLPVGAEQQAMDAVTRAGYAASLPDRTDQAELGRARISSLRNRLVVAALITLPLGNLAITLALVPSLRFAYWDWLCVLLAIPVVFWCAWPFHLATLRNIRHRSVSMDTLVSLGVLASFTWSVVSIALDDGGKAGYWVGFGRTPAGADSIYLEVAAAVTTFLLAGRYFEARARRAAADVLGALNRLGARQVCIVRDGVESIEPVSALRVGDEFVVRPGETIATDGIVRNGHGSIDASMMTGEPVPTDVFAGDRTLGGTVNLNGRLVISAERIGAHAQLAQMVVLAEQAQARKAAVQRLVDRVVSVFVPIVLVISVLVLLSWLWAGAEPRFAFGAAVSVLIIACPCAMGLATPTALMVGIGRGGQLGILVKGPDALEASGRIDTVVLDKTGTLTTGRMRVVAIQPADRTAAGTGTADELLTAAASLEQASEHPIARAIVNHAIVQGLTLRPVDNFAAHPGLGASASLAGQPWTIGNRTIGNRTINNWSASGGPDCPPDADTIVYLSRAGDLVGSIGLADQIKPSAAAAVRRLQGLGLRTVLLTGDQQATAERVGDELGVDQVLAGVLPSDKARTIAELQDRGAGVAMVGDGINDAAALATANLGIALVSGTDIAMKSADIIVVRDDLEVIADAVQLSRATLRTIRGNLLWAFGYNIAAIPLAAFGLLNPLIAGLAMSLSSVFVVTNSLRLRSFGQRSSGRRAAALPETGRHAEAEDQLASAW